MRLAAAACALVIVAVAALGAVLMHRTTVAGSAPTAASVAAEPAAPSTGAPALASVVTREVPISDAAPAAAPAPSQASSPAPTQAFAQAAPAAKGAAPAAATPATPAAAPAAPAAAATGTSCPGNPNALGVGRVVEIDTTGGPGFGFEHFKTHDFLRQGEVVLTFDDGPWPKNTPAVLAALAAHCTKAIFFPIGKHATWHPEILRQVAAAGHTIGSHTWGHVDLSKKTVTVDNAKDEIEKGLSAIRWAPGAPPAPPPRCSPSSRPTATRSW